MSTYSITTVTFQRRALFLRTANAELLVKTIFRYREQGRFLLHGFAVMPEHLHVLLTPADGQTIERCVQCIKGGFSFSVREQFAGEVWQAGFHEHRIRDSEGFLQSDRIRGSKSASAKAGGLPVCTHRLFGSIGWRALGHFTPDRKWKRAYPRGLKPIMIGSGLCRG
jgi:REP element-mobilizing transposase RayT